jgi:hypothetical protein
MFSDRVARLPREGRVRVHELKEGPSIVFAPAIACASSMHSAAVQVSIAHGLNLTSSGRHEVSPIGPLTPQTAG